MIREKLSFKFDFESMTLKHGVELQDGFFELYSTEMKEQDIEQLQFILWSVQKELGYVGKPASNEYTEVNASIQ